MKNDIKKIFVIIKRWLQSW